MSVDATRWAWQQQDISGAQKLVLLALADRAGESGDCYPSVARLVADTCMDRKTVMRAIDSLMSLGMVVDTGDRRGNGVRVLRLPCVDRHDTSTTSGTGTKSGTSTTSGTATGTKSGTATGTKCGTQNLSMNLKRNLSGKKYNAREARVVPRPPDVDDHVWSDYVGQRKAQRAPITQTAVDRIRTQADLAGVSMQEALETCLERGWRGFKAEWIAAPARAGSRGQPRQAAATDQRRDAMYQAIRELCEETGT